MVSTEMELYQKNVLVVGLGKSGMAAARFLRSRGARVTASDASGSGSADAVAELEQMGCLLELGGHRMETFENQDLIIVSPGVPHTIGPLCRAREKRIPVIGEIELASRFIQEPIVAITGTNGKTTTTTLVGEMLEASGMDVFVGGNIGRPLIEYVSGQPADRVVVEISSFQLDTIEDFRPDVAVLLNISPDHLDRYAGMPAYAASKARIFKNQTLRDTAILNGQDAWTLKFDEKIRARKLYFDGRKPGQPGADIKAGRLVLHLEDSNVRTVDLSEFKLVGRHNLENASAACLASLAAGGSLEAVTAALNGFKGLAHRVQYAGSVCGVEFFDDSKATTVDSVKRALECFDRPVILIMGGLAKGCDFHDLSEPVRTRCKKIVVIGEAADEIGSVLGPVCPGGVEKAFTMEDAVAGAFSHAVSGDTVLLSPACASFDMFSGYAQRGERFCQAIQKLRAANQ
jgi:UDP-N-acetylmuramoylalanine--D-glutamate ligase